MPVHRAAWVLPIVAEPIRDGAVVVVAGRVAWVGPVDHLPDPFRAEDPVDHGTSILLPGLVNAHTHLGLTGEHGRHPAGRGLLPWLTSLVPAARVLTDAEVRAAAAEGIAESWRLGTDLVGDIVTHPAVLDALAAHPHLLARAFFEFLGVREEPARRSFAAAVARAEALLGERSSADPPRVRPGLSPHAPYSVWPELFVEASRVAAGHAIPWTSHVGEPPEEREFLLAGGGALREYLRGLGVWDGTFPVPGEPALAFLERHDLLDENALLVHGLHLEPAEMHRLAVSDAALCLCPRSNAWLGLRPPPVRELVEHGVFLCVGTDSRASNADLSVWAELRELARLDPGLPPESLLRMATANGAEALGFTGSAGAIHPGLPARLIAVGAAGLGDHDPHAWLVREPVEEAVERVEPR